MGWYDTRISPLFRDHVLETIYITNNKLDNNAQKLLY